MINGVEIRLQNEEGKWKWVWNSVRMVRLRVEGGRVQEMQNRYSILMENSLVGVSIGDQWFIETHGRGKKPISNEVTP